jgi:hypothetical protein
MAPTTRTPVAVICVRKHLRHPTPNHLRQGVCGVTAPADAVFSPGDSVQPLAA